MPSYLSPRLARLMARDRMEYARVDSPGVLLAEHHRLSSSKPSFDIFLSHAREDETLVLGVLGVLELLGYTVYVDWVVDQQLDRTRVTAGHADLLRQRMRASRCLLYMTTVNSASSVWMPWELGYFDGHKPGQVAILPVLEEGRIFHGQEFLGLYPAIEYDTLPGETTPNLFVRPMGLAPKPLSNMARSACLTDC